ncbi:phosphoadenosine phosphosulfate reductase family protein [Microcoleus sp. FACHB-672]|uniref:phosphoadenosine phosphosulfate reductase family protein n=1 Tax=Microcoleus sp. FACHB-672 TaxID=2692825 RepID=UPI001684C5EA|nr:phosphoadenosine phosphosulfate reductase family protein [Microcoleus sp. FACHB-672]MBD2039508.1 phosphoadenosine phosphosulfate reductase family protein [Microcoleus sp. FACHB-672]
MSNIEERLEARYFDKFLPLIYSKSFGQRLIDSSPHQLRTWESRTGKVAIFHRPPPTIKEDAFAKPERLGRVIKQLAVCYRKDLRGKVALAREVLRTLFEATDNVAVAFSGGRDSLVALDIARKIRPDIPVMIVNTGIEFPESIKYVRQLAQDWNLNFYEVKPKVDFWKLTGEQGIPVAGRGNTTFMRDLSNKADVKLSNSCCRRMKETPARQFYREHKIEGVITGLRVSESLMRKLNFADYGALRYSKTYNTLIAWCLYAWKDQDIADYIQKYKLPLNPLYNMGYQRVGCWSCLQDMLYKDSRLFTLQKQHPKLYDVLIKNLGDEMMRLYSVWADIEDFELDTKELEGLYRPCDFVMLEQYRKENKKDSRTDLLDLEIENPS